MHRLYTGITGSGKTTAAVTDFLDDVQENFGILIDPLGDSAEEFMLQATDRLSPFRRRDIHYLEVTPECCFSLNLLKTCAQGAAAQWALAALVDSIMECFAQGQGAADMKEMPLRDRVMKDVLYWIGTRQNDGSHYGFQKAFDCLDMHRKTWETLFNFVKDRLPQEVEHDFQNMRLLSITQFNQFTQSTVNWMRRILTPPVLAVLSHNEHSLDLDEVMKNKGIIVCNFRSPGFLSFEQSSILCGLMANKIIETNERLRIPTTLFCEEFHRYPTHRFLDAYSTGRHNGLSIAVTTQSLDGLKNKNIDLLKRVVSQSRIIKTFRHRDPEDVEYLGRLHAQPNLCFDPLMQEVQVHDGYDFFLTKGESYSRTRSWGINRSKSKGVSAGVSSQRGQSDSTSTGWNHGTTSSEGHGTQRGEKSGKSKTTSASESKGEQRSHGDNAGASFPLKQPNFSTSVGSNNSYGETSSSQVGASESEEHSESVGVSDNISFGFSDGVNGSHSSSRNRSTGASFGVNSSSSVGDSSGGAEGYSCSYRLMTLARYRTELRETGRLRFSINDQVEFVKTLLVTFPTGTCFLTVDNLPTVILETDRLPELGCQSWRKETFKRMKLLSFTLRRCYFVPIGWKERSTEKAAPNRGKQGMNESSKGRGKRRS